jgi:uncharacterized cupredoxin-like copper-binding protein
MKRSIVVLFAAAALSAPGTQVSAGPGHDQGHGHAEEYAAGVPGDAKKPARIVAVKMLETSDGRMIYEPSKLVVKKGEQVRFVITNVGEIPHEFVLATVEQNLKHAELMKKYPEMEHDDPNSKTIQPKSKAEIIWRFTKTGAFEFACLIPGHREAGMIGNVDVK